MKTFHAKQNRPLARADGLLSEAVDGEIVVYDEERNVAHSLSPSAAMVWHRCDGHTSWEEISEQSGLPLGTVKRAVHELDEARLLTTPGITRRDAGKRAAVLGGALVVANALVYSVPVPASAAACSQTPCASPPSGFPNTLSGFLTYAVFAINGNGFNGSSTYNSAPTGTQTVNLSLGTINSSGGNPAVGVGPKADVTQQGPFIINGNVVVSPTGTFTGAHSFTTSSQVDTDRIDALDFSATAAGYTATQTFSSITTATTINGGSTAHGGVPYLNVIQVNGNITNSVTLNGTTNDWWIINVTGNVALTGAEAITETGGTTASQVIINMTGTSATLNTGVGDILDAIVLGPHVGGDIHSGNVSLLLGGDFSISSGAVVTSAACSCTP